MQDDDVYQNDGSYFLPREPEEQVIARKKEQAKTLEAAKVIDSVITHFDERIAYRDSISALKIDATREPAMHQKACEVNELLKMALLEEKDLLEDLLAIHAPNR